MKLTKNEVKIMTREEASYLIKRAPDGTTFSFRSSVMLPIVEGEEEGKFFEGIAYVRLTRKEAIRAVESLLSPTLQKRGARLKVEITIASEEPLLAIITVGF